MSSALSPTTKAVARDAEPVSQKEFAEHIKYFQATHKAIVTLTALVNRLPANQSLKIGSHTIRRSDVSKYSQTYVSQLADLRKIYAKRKRRNAKGGSQLNSLFYVSDQLVDFYKNAKLGPANPDAPKKGKLASEISLLTEKHMATSGILTSLITRYIEANGLKSEAANGRFKPDDRMIDSFCDCIYTLNGKDISRRKIRPDTPADKAERVQANIKQGKLSAFDRVSDRTDKRSGEPVYDEDTGLLYTTMMVFNNFYRVPNCLLSDAEREQLSDADNIEEARALQERLTSITSWHHKN